MHAERDECESLLHAASLSYAALGTWGIETGRPPKIKNRRRPTSALLPLYPRKRTWLRHRLMSAMCHSQCLRRDKSTRKRSSCHCQFTHLPPIASAWLRAWESMSSAWQLKAGWLCNRANVRALIQKGQLQIQKGPTSCNPDGKRPSPLWNACRTRNISQPPPAAPNVRFGSKADITWCPSHVRFTPKSGYWSAVPSVPCPGATKLPPITPLMGAMAPGDGGGRKQRCLCHWLPKPDMNATVWY